MGACRLMAWAVKASPSKTTICDRYIGAYGRVRAVRYVFRNQDRAILYTRRGGLRACPKRQLAELKRVWCLLPEFGQAFQQDYDEEDD